jgi:RNA polymerase sigma-70 factor (sigma-E family)
VQPTAESATERQPEPVIKAVIKPDIEPDIKAVIDEPVSFEAYVAARGPALIRFASRLTGSPHRAEDLVQDALAKAYQRWDSILRKDQPDVYLRRLLVNGARSWWRPRSNRELPVEQPLGERADAHDLSAQSAERDEMWRLIATLPARQRAVLVLRYYEDLDDSTIAAILDCSPVTVRTHAMRALTVLRSHFTTTDNDRADDGANDGQRHE